MEKILESDLLESLKSRFPDSIPYWKEYLEDKECRSMTVIALETFADYVFALLQLNDQHSVAEIQKIFDYMEFLLIHGDQGVKDAVATGFLEAIDNESFKDQKVKNALPRLGDECKAYLKAWDDFWKGRNGSAE